MSRWNTTTCPRASISNGGCSVHGRNGCRGILLPRRRAMTRLPAFMRPDAGVKAPTLERHLDKLLDLEELELPNSSPALHP